MLKKVFLTVLLSAALGTEAFGQKGEITLSLNEGFFDAMLESFFQNFDPPQFSLARVDSGLSPAKEPWSSLYRNASFRTGAADCENVTILREMKGVRTAVKFRDGRVIVPLAFSGGYSAPLIGCMQFNGIAESNLDLEFDATAQKLVGRVRVASVNLNGTGGLGGPIIARMIQGTIDKKVNPVDILTLDKVSFAVPILRSGVMRLKATGLKHEVAPGELRVEVAYDFAKG